MFIANFNYRKNVALTFLPKLLNFITWAVVKQFQSHLVKVASNIKYVYITCGFFIFLAEVTWLQYINLIF